MEETIKLPAFITTLVVVSVTLIIGMFIMAEISDGVRADVTTTGSDSTAFASFDGSLSLDILSTDSSAACAGVLVYNATDDSVILSTGNYTLTNCAIVVTGASPYNATSTYVNYTYSYTTEGVATVASNASDDLVDSLSNGTGWIAILLVVGFATIILALLSGGLAASARNEQPMY